MTLRPAGHGGITEIKEAMKGKITLPPAPQIDKLRNSLSNSLNCSSPVICDMARQCEQLYLFQVPQYHRFRCVIIGLCRIRSPQLANVRCNNKNLEEFRRLVQPGTTGYS